jgi:RimJ/RimL family protein N-acetyltransferase
LVDHPGFRIDWHSDVGELAAIEPTRAELLAHAPALVVGYNEPANARLMGHTEEMTADDVVAHYEDMADEGARQFLLFVDGKLAGDADLRGITGGAAEFAFMIGARDQQGKGLGTKFALMVHAFAFQQLELRRVYASIVPENVASRRVFEKLGYVLDDGAEARSYADEPGDIVMGIDRATFARANATTIPNLRLEAR